MLDRLPFRRACRGGRHFAGDLPLSRRWRTLRPPTICVGEFYAMLAHGMDEIPRPAESPPVSLADPLRSLFAEHQ